MPRRWQPGSGSGVEESIGGDRCGAHQHMIGLNRVEVESFPADATPSLGDGHLGLLGRRGVASQGYRQSG